VLKQLSFRLIVFSLFVILVSAACGKGSGGSGGGGVTPTPPTPPTPTEENIVFTYDIDPGSNIYAALGTTQEVKITVITLKSATTATNTATKTFKIAKK